MHQPKGSIAQRSRPACAIIVGEAQGKTARRGRGGVFAQSAIAVLERATLYLVGSCLLPYSAEAELVRAVHRVRKALGLPPAFLSLHDWPEDEQTGHHLERLLMQLDALEDAEQAKPRAGAA